MFKVIIPKTAFKELEKIDSENQKLVYLQRINPLKVSMRESLEKELVIIELFI